MNTYENINILAKKAPGKKKIWFQVPNCPRLGGGPDPPPAPTPPPLQNQRPLDTLVRALHSHRRSYVRGFSGKGHILNGLICKNRLKET